MVAAISGLTGHAALCALWAVLTIAYVSVSFDTRRRRRRYAERMGAEGQSVVSDDA